ncbi:MAG: hypothetical protein Q9215_000056 [Flavoplaca cf. flavocitrina]
MAAANSQEAAQGFDSETGQVYVERTCKAGPMTPDWTWKSRGNLDYCLTRSHNQAGPGSSSLRETSIRKVLAALYNLTPDLLQTLPLHLVRELWLEIERSQLDSLRTWKVFTSVFANQRNDRPVNKMLVLSESTTNLLECIMHIVSPSFQFITFITLSNISCLRNDLIQLSRLTNLGMLRITTGFPDSTGVSLEDRIIRAWGRAAAESGAFTKLRILVCKYQTHLTSEVFAYLRDFPALDVVVLDGCWSLGGVAEEAEKHEWHATAHSKLRHDSLGYRSPPWKDIYSRLLNNKNLSVIEAMGEASDHDENSVPILDVSMVSAVQPASLQLNRCQNLSDHAWYFRRKGRCADPGSLPMLRPQRRARAEDPDARSQALKKPAMRSSQQRTMKDSLADFQI